MLTFCVAQFVQNVWIESYDPTIEDSYRKQIEVDVSDTLLNVQEQTVNRSTLGPTMYFRNVRTPLKYQGNTDGNSLDTAGTEQFSKLSTSSER